MNLYTDGSHLASDWLFEKLRAFRVPLALFVRDDGQLRVRDARRLPAQPVSSYVGTYRLEGFEVASARGDMELMRAEHWRPDRIK